MPRQIPLLGIVPEKPDPNDNKFHVAIKTADGAVVSEALLDENFQPVPSGGGGDDKEDVIVKIIYSNTVKNYTGTKSAKIYVNDVEIQGITHPGTSVWDSSHKVVAETNYIVCKKGDILSVAGAKYIPENLREVDDSELKTDVAYNSSTYYIDSLKKDIEIEGPITIQVYDYSVYDSKWPVTGICGSMSIFIQSYDGGYVSIYGEDEVMISAGSNERGPNVHVGSGDSVDIELNTPYGSIYHNGVVVSTGSGCLVKGTMITMADGSKKAIEDVRSGDEVLSYDFEHQTAVPAVVLFNTEHEATVYSRKQLFSDGSTLETVGEHYVYNVNGSACSDIQAWDTGDAAQKVDGTVVEYCGYISCSSPMTRNWNLITSNNTYYANDILNTCWPGTKFKMLAARGIKMPTELYEAVKQEFDYHRNGTTKANNPEFIAAVKEVEQQCSTLAKTISKNKKILDKTDYQMVKTSEQINDAILDSKDFDDFKSKVAAIYSKEFTKKVNERKAARDAIVAVEEQSAQLYDQVQQIKRQFGVWSEFEDMTHREQFMVCNKLGCENLERYRAWDFVTKAKEIFSPKEEVKEEEPKEETKSTKKKK